MARRRSVDGDFWFTIQKNQKNDGVAVDWWEENVGHEFNVLLKDALFTIVKMDGSTEVIEYLSYSRDTGWVTLSDPP